MPQGNDYFSIRYSTSSTKKATTAIDFSNIPRYPHTKGEDSSKCRKSPTISVSFAYFLTLLNLHRSFFFLFPFPLALVHLNVHHYWQKASPPVSLLRYSAITTRRHTTITIDTSLFRTLERNTNDIPDKLYIPRSKENVKENVFFKNSSILTIRIIWKNRLTF